MSEISLETLPSTITIKIFTDNISNIEPSDILGLIEYIIGIVEESKQLNKKNDIKKLGKYKRVKSEHLDMECCICMSKYVKNEGIRFLKCGHSFHKGCVDKWLKDHVDCPICRQNAFED